MDFSCHGDPEELKDSIFVEDGQECGKRRKCNITRMSDICSTMIVKAILTEMKPDVICGVTDEV